MPSVSKRQFRFMKAVQNNKENMFDAPKSLSPEKAKEFTSDNKGKKAYKKLPESKGKWSKIKKHMKGD